MSWKTKNVENKVYYRHYHLMKKFAQQKREIFHPHLHKKITMLKFKNRNQK